jgi:rod shape-determining protein MreD
MAYSNLQMRQKLLGLPMLAQSVWVLFLLLLAQVLILWTQRMDMAESMRALYWLPSLTGALAWPVLLGVMQRLGRLGVTRGS